MSERKIELLTVRRVLGLILFFFVEIALTFSDKTYVEHTYPEEKATPVSHVISNNLSQYESMDTLDSLIESFMDKWGIVGASVAIAKDEKLLYAKGFGYADKEAGVEVDTKHLFRIASVSKLITATAIMKLVERDSLELSDKVFGEDGILNDSSFRMIKDPRVKEITIKHLLEHSGGWDKRKGDPVFRVHSIAYAMDKTLPIGLDIITEYVLKERSLDFSPGERVSYSNFGYALLGEIIAKTSGTSYEDFVTTNILNPIGVYDFHLGHSLAGERFQNEVNYYGLQNERKIISSFGNGELVPKFYGGNPMETLGAAGAWVASPAEMVKFLVAIDGQPGKPDILSSEALEMMASNSNGTRPFGWTGTTPEGFYWRTGTLSGTSALLIKQPNGLSWFFVMNTTPRYGARFPVQINRTMLQGMASVENWPEYDLFEFRKPSVNTLPLLTQR
ncbi:MAG: serine hydrolase domain-containing protein [Bacteroidales bacterium]